MVGSLEGEELIGDSGAELRVVCVVAFVDVDGRCGEGVDAESEVDPLPESAECCGYCRYAESDGFEGSVAPGFVVAWEYCGVEGGEEVVVGQTAEDFVGAIEIAGDVDHEELAGGRIFESETVDV